MEINKDIKSKIMKRQLYRFFISGVSAVVTDFIIYYILIKYMDHSNSKVISFFSGTLVSYFTNKFWTFEKKNKSIKELMKFMALYTSTLCVNVAVNKIVLDFTNVVILGFLFATGTSTTLNFIGQKWWVFKK